MPSRLGIDDTYKVNKIDYVVLRSLQTTGEKNKRKSKYPKTSNSSVLVVPLSQICILSVSSTVPIAQQKFIQRFPNFLDSRTHGALHVSVICYDAPTL